MPTYLFDEVDAGVGGKAAVEVGRRLARLAKSGPGRRRHAPAAGGGVRRPAAAGGEDQRRVGDPRGVKVLEGEDRVRELSRMLAGQEDSETARAHAEELLAAARADG